MFLTFFFTKADRGCCEALQHSTTVLNMSHLFKRKGEDWLEAERSVNVQIYMATTGSQITVSYDLRSCWGQIISSLDKRADKRRKKEHPFKKELGFNTVSLVTPAIGLCSPMDYGKGSSWQITAVSWIKNWLLLSPWHRQYWGHSLV